MEVNNEKEGNDALPVDQSVSNFIQPEVKTSFTFIFLLAFIVILIAAGGTFWYMQSKKINAPVQASESGVDNNKINQAAEVTKKLRVKEEYITPAGYRKIVESLLGISFDIPNNWQKSTEPESGISSYTTENFSSKSMKITGAYIAYDLYTAPEGYKGTPDEYLNSLKSNPNKWNELMIDGYKAFITTTDWPNQPGSINTEIVGKIGNRFLYIHFLDEKGSNQPQFDLFLKSVDLP
jgi:hypothetical protein